MARLVTVIASVAMLGIGPALADSSIKSPIPLTSSVDRPPSAASKRADFRDEHPSDEARSMADWVVESSDNEGLPFIVVDKAMAKVYVFDGYASLRGADSALLGSARGDRSVPGIGSRPMASIRPDERTTPAGRFMASLEQGLHGEEILWIDYDAAVALHRIVTSFPKERRLQRLKSPVPSDHRITYGCINVSIPFFEAIVMPTFKEKNGVVYILPETISWREIFSPKKT